MARYSSYYYSRRQKSRIIRFSIIGGVVALVGIIILVSFSGEDDSEQVSTPKNIMITEAVPVKAVPVPKPKPKPKPQSKPVSKPQPKPEPKPNRIEPITISTQTTSPQAAALIADADKEIAGGEIISAREKLNQALSSMQLNAHDTAVVKAKLTELAGKWLFSRDCYPGDTLTSLYKVKSGDLLSTIGKKNNVPYETLMMVNGIKDPRFLRAGDTIKVVNGPFHAIVYRSTFTMDLYIGTNTYVKTYRIGIGEEGKDTPLGKWRVRTNGKLVEPPWPNPEGGIVHPGDPEYPLGSRWIGLVGLEGEAKDRTGFGLHGTKEPESIGTRSSQGCIRLHNGEVIEIYNLLTPGLSEVRVVD